MSNKRHKYFNKAPYSTLHPDARHWTRKGNSWKAKVAYETEDDVLEFMNTHPKLIEQGMTVYRCNLCNMFHCGHNHNKK